MSGGRRVLKIESLRNQTVIADKCVVAEDFWSRLRGLIGRRRLEAGEGMFFPRCNDIHMWFMRIPIDVVFLKKGSAEGRWLVSSVREHVRPWRPLPLMDWHASETVELPAGTVGRCGIEVGDELWLS